MPDPPQIDVYVPGDPSDPRDRTDVPAGVNPHYGPPLHPDDIAVIDGIPVTSPSRTLIDLAEVLGEAELRKCFVAARRKGLLDLDALAAARARVERRPSLAMLDRVISEFV